ncbi:MAG: class I lanthipeptide [Hyphomicrobiales bacterium]
MKKKTLNFNKSTVAQLNNVEQNNINGAAITGFCHNSNPAYVTCPAICPYTEMCSEYVCQSEWPCYTDKYMAC